MALKKLSTREIQLYELEILKRFDKFCKKNNLRYYLIYGTLLGAIRHKGFIPWDDDIDVCMPRPDYEMFVKTFHDDECQHLKLRSNLLGNLAAPYAKLIDVKTKIDSKYSHFDTNLYIDIFPVDGMPENIHQMDKIRKACRLYKQILTLTGSKLGEGKTTFRKYSKYFLKPLSRLYGRQRCINKIENIAKQYPYDNCKYVRECIWADWQINMLKSAFEQAVEVEFEGYKFPTFSCWDDYLKELYGDYMQLPPVEQRKTHDMKAYLIEE